MKISVAIFLLKIRKFENASLWMCSQITKDESKSIFLKIKFLVIFYLNIS
jgi:hypothetical protein